MNARIQCAHDSWASGATKVGIAPAISRKMARSLAMTGVPGSGYALHAGLWLLISTPIARVVMALASYLRERDWTFVALTLLVLACLAIPLARYFLWSPR